MQLRLRWDIKAVRRAAVAACTLAFGLFLASLTIPALGAERNDLKRSAGPPSVGRAAMSQARGTRLQRAPGEVIRGTDEGETLTGGPDDDTIHAYGGDDRLTGPAGTTSSAAAPGATP